ncbi:MAG: hypothetical protein ACE5G0_03775 [Rhodothermales bacterium]
MRKLSISLLILLLVGWTTGCDSNDGDDQSDAEVFVGSWTLANLLINGQDLTAALFLLAEVNRVEIDFESNGTFRLQVVSASSPPEVTGTYSLNESLDTVTLTSSDFAAPVTLSYEIENNNRIVLDTDDVALLVELSGIDPSSLGLQVERLELILRRS